MQDGTVLNRFFQVVTVTLAALAIVFSLFEVIKYLSIDAPLNYYEPELAIESWALSQGQQTHPPYEEGPFSGLYAPLFQVTGSLLFRLFGPSLILLRLISMASVAGIAWIIYRLAHAPSRWGYPLWLMGLLMWHNTLVGFDMQAKPDSFAVLLAFAGLGMAIRAERNPESATTGWLFSGSFCALAVAAKQPMLFMAPAIGIVLLSGKNWRAIALYSGAFAAVSVLVWFALYKICGPMLFHNVFVAPGQYEIRFGVLADTINFTLTGPWLLAAFVLLINRYRTGDWERIDTLLLSALLWSVPASLLTAAKAGGLNNALQPLLYLIMAVLARNAWHFYATTRDFWQGRSKGAARAALAVLVLATFRINPPGEITRTRQLLEYRSAYKSAIRDIRREYGQVFVPMDNYLALKGAHPINYSLKSEQDVFPPYVIRPEIRHSERIAAASDLVITHRYSTWYNPAEWEDMLQTLGFRLEKVVRLDYNLELAYWRK